MIFSPKRLITKLTAILQNPRLRAEVGWVAVHRLIDLPLTFIMLKAFTTMMGKEVYGEYSLALSGLMLLSFMITMPMNQAYLRHYHKAAQDGTARSAGMGLLRWYAVATLVVALLAAGFGVPLSRWLKVGKWTVLAAGLLFVGSRWRYLGLSILDIRRRRRASATHYLSWQVVHIGFVCGALYLWRVSAAIALSASALSAAIFALLIIVPFARRIWATSPGSTGGLGRLTITFGLPYGALFVCQWLQGFSDRYILAYHLDLEAVGAYVAVFQVCGISFVMLMGVLNTLLLPVAYGRARDTNDPTQLWAADRALLGGVGIYLAIGAAMLAIYGFLGPWLVELLTQKDYVLPIQTIILLAVGRYIQCLGILLQSFFAVHQKMPRLLWFRIIGAVVTIPTYWLSIRTWGIAGAAMGMCAVMTFYVLIETLGPGGLLWLILDSRKRCHRRRLGESSVDEDTLSDSLGR